MELESFVHNFESDFPLEHITKPTFIQYQHKKYNIFTSLIYPSVAPILHQLYNNNTALLVDHQKPIGISFEQDPLTRISMKWLNVKEIPIVSKSPS